MTSSPPKSPPQPVLLSEYKPPTHLISHIDLDFELEDEKTRVRSRLQITCNGHHQEHLVLNGENLQLVGVSLDGHPLAEHQYATDDKTLTILSPPQEFTLEVETIINPKANTALEGLYKSGTMFCTQNEPEGFRRITYFLDRPDVMARYRCKITADKNQYPILLSNGNPIASGDVDDGRHWVEWEDPFPKPTYLFALVAGDLGVIKDTFTTCSGRKIDLRVYCDKGNEHKCTHAMESLKKAMKWDEETFGLEYDLDIFMIVAVDAFNFGAMENKGLNVFNTSCVLADPETATDGDYLSIEGIVAHEYFHNWTGNRVTCRDWFQLTLKEGLTVFRDQEFSADMHSRPVKRIQDVLKLRTVQFAEDAGPTAHPIKPKSYLEINNFYTTTVYEKGAEVIRMIQTLIGTETFRKGITRYFELYDGQAVTTEDFVYAMEQVSGHDLRQFARWYHQAGTPEVRLGFDYNYTDKVFYLTVKQHCEKTADGSAKEPFHFPLEIGLLGPDGRDLSLGIAGNSGNKAGTTLQINKPKETFTFRNIAERPVPSINRHFSAPVNVHAEYAWEDYQFLMAHDSDSFIRWEAGQELAMQMMLSMLQEIETTHKLKVYDGYLDAYEKVLLDPDIDLALKAKALVIPSEDSMHQRQEIIDFDGIYLVRENLVRKLAERFETHFLNIYHEMAETGPYAFDSESVGRRALKNTCLYYLVKTDKEDHFHRCHQQFVEAYNMTDRYSALRYLVDCATPFRDEAIQRFHDQWKDDKLVIMKWLAAQAASVIGDTLKTVKALTEHPAYDKTIPNLVRGLLRSFGSNHIHFNVNSGEAYAFMADHILELDPINPMMAAALAGCFKKYGKLDPLRKKVMKPQLTRIRDFPGISPNVYEIVTKCLA